MDSYQLFEQVEQGKVEVYPQVKAYLMQLLLATCDPVNGGWIGIPVMTALNVLEEIARGHVISAKDQLQEPELSRELRKSVVLLYTIKKIRKDLMQVYDGQ